MKQFIFWIANILFLFCLTSAKSYSGPKYNINAWKNFDKFAESLAKKYGLTVLTTGDGNGLIGNYRTRFSVGYASHQQLTLEQARTFAQPFMREMLDKMYQDPVYYRYNLGDYPDKAKEFPPVFMGFKVSYWDDNINPLKPPYIAKIIATGESIKYYYVDPETYILQEPIVEQFVYSP